MSHRLTAGARDRPAMASLRLLAVLHVARRDDVARNGDTARKNERATAGRPFFAILGLTAELKQPVDNVTPPPHDLCFSSPRQGA